MADKVLKSLTFPGLEDRYIVQGAIDDTLSVEGKAADAKATGDAIGLVNGRIDGTNNANYQEDRRLDMLTTYESGGGSQLVDLSGKTVVPYGSVYSYQNISIDFSNNGKYYVNPVGKSVTLHGIKFYDENGTLLKYDTNKDTIADWTDWTVFEIIDNTTVKLIMYGTAERFYADNVFRTMTYEYDGTIAYAICARIDTKTEELAKTGIGVTFDAWMRYYNPYNISMGYASDMCEGLFREFVDKGRFKNIPNNTITPWMQSTYAETDNLLDERKIDWNSAGNNYAMKPGEYVPVQGGNTVLCNRGMGNFTVYDSSGNATPVGNFGAWTPITIPSGSVSCSFSLWKSSFPSGDKSPTILFYQSKMYPYDEHGKIPYPMAQINGWDINKNIYDYCIPEEQSEFVRMMKTFVIREMNRQRNAFRFATFNVYVNRQATNKEVIRKMMGTYGIDACGFQESQNYQGDKRYNLGDYLKGWQFQYCSTAEEDLASARHIVSVLEITSSEAFSIGTGTNTCLKCTINMPKYKDYKNGVTTLSFYTYHGIVTGDTERETEVNDILAKVAIDTSDFIIVCGDTNDFSGQPNYTHDRWAQFAAAGLTPIHNGESSTVTEIDNMSIDNMFVSGNIKCLYYNVVNSTEWMYTPPGASVPVPVSDHDIVYADLQFDFEAAIAARNQSN